MCTGETDVDGAGAVDESAPLNPTNPYAATKAAAEMLALSYRHSFKLPLITTRGNNVFGPGQFPEKVVPRFLRQLLAGRKMTVQGRGEAKRSLLFVEDCANAIVHALRCGRVGAIYNIGTQNELSVCQVAQVLPRYSLSHAWHAMLNAVSPRMVS